MQPLLSEDPSVVGPYRLLGRLGAGGMGCVYLGRTAGGRTVAVKVVKPELVADAEFRARFRREVAAARKVSGAWTAPVLEADTESAQPWVASGYVAGFALGEAVADFGPLPEDGVRALAAGLAEALTVVHGSGLIHRDLKPSNVMLSPEGPVLIDFGIARAMDGSATASLTSTGITVGSPGYMSPEQVQGHPLGAASDVFQLGTVLAFAATGRGPFSADSAATMLYKVAHAEPELGDLAGELRELAEACLAKEPAARPTPQQIVARLAPRGAAELVDGGWLPGPLLARISRRTVELLNLEGASAGSGPAVAAPPQPAAWPVQPLTPPAQPLTPPVQPAAAQVQPAAWPAQPPAPPAQPPGFGPVVPSATEPNATGPAAPDGTMRLLAAQDGQASKVRKGRSGRWALLAGAGVLVVAGVATAVAMLLPGSSSDAAIPAAFAGSWQGDISGLAGGISLHVPDAAKKAPITGVATILAMVSPDGGETGICHLSYTRREVTDQKLVLTAKAIPADGASCPRYFDGQVTVTLGNGRSLQESWTDHDGKTVTATLTPDGN